MDIDFTNRIDEFYLSKSFMNDMYNKYILGLKCDELASSDIGDLFIPYINRGDNALCAFRFFECQGSMHSMIQRVTYFVYFDPETGEYVDSDIFNDIDTTAYEIRELAKRANQCFSYLWDHQYLRQKV